MNLYSVRIKQEDKNESFAKTIYVVCEKISQVEELTYTKVASDWKILVVTLMDSDVLIAIKLPDIAFTKE